MRLLLSFLLLTLTACTHYNAKLSMTDLPHTRELGKQLEAHQLLQIELNDQQVNLPLLLSINENELRLVGLTDMGSRLFSIHWNNTDLVISRELEYQKIPLQEIMTTLYLALWPEASLSFYLTSHQLTLVTEQSERQYFNSQGRQVLSIKYFKHTEPSGLITVQSRMNYQLKTLSWAVSS